jgi:hypothetical protein
MPTQRELVEHFTRLELALNDHTKKGTSLAFSSLERQADVFTALYKSPIGTYVSEGGVGTLYPTRTLVS